MVKYRLYIFVLVLLCLFPVNALPDVNITDILIDYSGPENFRKQIPQIIPFKKGMRIEKKVVSEYVDRLQKTGHFSDVSYDLVSQGKDNYGLKLILKKYQKVRNIRVVGNYPILAKQIKKLVTLQPGTNFKPELLPESVAAIKKYLEKRGFYEAEVEIEVKDFQEAEVKDLVVRIKRGKTYRINDIVIEGNHFISKKKIRNKISRYSRFRMDRIKKDLKSIKKMYAAHGFVKTRVKLEDVFFYEDTHKVDLQLKIRENKKFKIVLEGKTYFNKERLKAVTRLKELRSYDRYAIKKGKMRLEKYYHLRGFPNVQIQSEILKPAKYSVVAKYTIKTGKRVDLKKIKFVGNENLGSKKLKKIMTSQESSFGARSFFDAKDLFDDKFDLEKFYKENGFFDVTVSDPNFNINRFGDQKIATYQIQEGNQYIYNHIKIVSDLDVDKDFLLKKAKLKTGKSYSLEKLEEARQDILEILLGQGYAYATIDVETHLDHATQLVDVSFMIVRGPRVQVRSIMIDGDLVTTQKTIRKSLKVNSGDVFQYKKMLEGQLNLRKLGVFTSVRITPLGFEEKSDTIDLMVSVIERKTVVINLQTGFDSRHWVTGEFNFTKYNLFGSGRQLNSRFIGGPKYDRIEMTFYAPRVFGASWNLSVQGFGEYEDDVYYTDINYGAFASTLKNFGPHWTFGFKEQVSRTEVFESESDTATLGDSLFDNTFNEFQLSLLFDLRDNFSDPQKGFYILAQNELNTDLSNIKNNFNTFRFNINHYLGFLKRFTLVNTFRYGHTFELSSSPRIPVNKLFFLGGADTLRGFSEDGIDPSGGTIMMIYNAELQYRITESIKIAPFFDAGIIGDDINQLNWSDVRESAGVGLRYFTPIGPIRLDWGFILDRKPGEPSNRIHFSFGYFF